MARFRLGLAGALILAFLSAWFAHCQPCCAGASIAALPANEAVSEGHLPGGAPGFTHTSSTDDQSDDLWSGRRAASLRAPDQSWWLIGPPSPDAALWRPRARSTGPPPFTES